VHCCQIKSILEGIITFYYITSD